MSIPPAVLAQYQAVTADATKTAQTPFQSYGTAGATNADGSAQQFVAPVNANQQAGIAGTNAAANEAQPGYSAAQNTLGAAQAGTTDINNAATGLAAASGQNVNASDLDSSAINKYMSPYLGDVLNSTDALANQNNNIAQSGQLGTAISSGAFGGDRTGLAAANLNQQNQLALNSTNAGILNTGYNNALSTAQQQQGVNLAAGQANRAAYGTAAQTLAGVGQTAYGEGANTASEQGALASGAQTAGLQGAQAQIAAGTVEQQTQQAQDTAEYNQYEQQQSYPFQVDQFLANIVEGTGALSGSTTTTSQPGGFFSDKRLKHDIRKVGKTFDGQDIVSYKMHGDDRTRMGLIAQDVEKKHPDAVGLAAGYKIVDYGKATEKAANRGHFYSGGVVPFRQAKAGGGPSIVSPADYSAILQAQQQMYAPMSGGVAGVYGQAGGPHGGTARVPAPTGATPHLVTAEGGLKARNTGAQNTEELGKLYNEGKGMVAPRRAAATGVAPDATPATASQPWSNPGTNMDGSGNDAAPDQNIDGSGNNYARGVRQGLADGGMPYSTDHDLTELDIPNVDSHNQLAKAPDLPKQAPTGFQQLMSMGSGMGGGGMGGMGGMMGGLGGGGGDAAGDAGGGISDLGEEAASAGDSRGGLVRAKRDAGGEISDDDDAPHAKVDEAPPLAHAAPNTSLDSVKHAALAVGDAFIGNYPGAAMQGYDAYNSTQTNNKRGGRIGKDGGGGLGDADISDTDTPAPDSDLKMDHGPSWWDRNKGNILPAVQGLAAMGTAPTKHLGVALAAGLGAGAASYVPTQQGLANTRQTEAETQGYKINNQMNQQTLDLYKSVLNRQKDPKKSPMPVQDPGDLPLNEVDLPTYYQQKYSPVMTQDEQQNIGQSKFIDAKAHTNLTAGAQLAYDQRIAGQRVSAQRDFDRFNAVAHSDTAYTDLKQVSPGMADRLAKATGLDPDNQDIWKPDQKARANEAAAKIAGAHAYQANMYTGSKYDDLAGQKIDDRSGSTAVGLATQGLGPAATNEAKLGALGTVDTGAPAHPTKASLAKENGISLAGVPNSPKNLPAGAGAGGGGGSHGVVDPMTPATKSNNPNIVGGAPLEPDYKRPADFSNTVAQTPEQQLAAGEVIKSRTALMDDNKVLSNASQQGLTYTKAAQDIMASHGDIAGLGAAQRANISRVFQALGITSGVNATNYDVLAKQLGNIAVQNFKENFGARPAAKEFDIQMNTLNPDAKMTPDAINDLLSFNGKNFKYSGDTASRAAEFDRKGGNPMQFWDWNKKHFDQPTIVTGGAVRPGQETSGDSFVVGKKYNDKHGNSAVYLGNGKWQ